MVRGVGIPCGGRQNERTAHNHIYIYIVTPPTTHRPHQNTVKPVRHLLFCWSDFDSFSDAAFVSNSKTGKAKAPRIQKSNIHEIQKSKNPKLSHLRHLAKKLGFLSEHALATMAAFGLRACGQHFCPSLWVLLLGSEASWGSVQDWS